ncbi:acyl carrier protein [Bradyrhizobium sp. 182]|uniref:acyl carrier protein n=1 Tax=unclassified Bradyrhizobium TaxID=2631580 RepID=UPI001FFBF9E2|nr:MULTISPECIES: acyl carrier protein [unclassified Bradyrhizobium]MCK1424827.1 acyl carrier protein [Bradyrhizobium sp. CW12]MCK1531857.1 acyl carrier protein [Bradyrhizobium sp. 182]MCK1646508.1 acyl carrier protein [Bradyrhizobium sp. 154]
MRDKIQQVFNAVWREQNGTKPPVLESGTLLLDTGLDSLGFAIIVTRLDDELGYDPFTIAENAIYPQTFGEFAAFYEKYRPAS